METDNNDKSYPQLTINPFRNKAGEVVRTLLQDPNKAWRGTELAEKLNYKSRWVNCVLSTLESYGHVERIQKRHLSQTRIIDQKELLKHWQTVYRFNHNIFHDYYCIHKDPLKILAEASQKLVYRWALTGKCAEQLLKGEIGEGVPMIYLTVADHRRIRFREVLTELEDQCGFLPVGKNPNIILIEPKDPEGVFFDIQSKKGIPVVSPLQLSLDLGKAG